MRQYIPRAAAHFSFIEIPFNVWEETGMKGNIPCRVSVHGVSFECKLIPKGKGNYLIPVTKKTLSELESEDEYEIELEPIETLSRINHDSPYSAEHPIRKIDSIEAIPVEAGFCGHCCVAMLAGVPLSEAVALMGKVTHRGQKYWRRWTTTGYPMRRRLFIPKAARTNCRCAA